MSASQLLADYGYLAVFGASLLEGEVLLALAGVAAQQGRLSLPLVIAIAFVGGTLGDQIFFWLGRLWGDALLNRFPRAASRAERVKRLLEQHHVPLIIGVRFMYGLRIIGPIVIGSCKVSAWRFAALNMIGAAIWAPLVAGGGYLFGDALARLGVELGRLDVLLLVLVVAGGAIVWWRR